MPRFRFPIGGRGARSVFGVTLDGRGAVLGPGGVTPAKSAFFVNDRATGAGAFAFAGTGSGAVNLAATCAGSFAFAGTGSGAVNLAATCAGSFAFDGLGDGTIGTAPGATIGAAGTGSFSFDGIGGGSIGSVVTLESGGRRRRLPFARLWEPQKWEPSAAELKPLLPIGARGYGAFAAHGEGIATARASARVALDGARFDGAGAGALRLGGAGSAPFVSRLDGGATCTTTTHAGTIALFARLVADAAALRAELDEVVTIELPEGVDEVRLEWQQ